MLYIKASIMASVLMMIVLENCEAMVLIILTPPLALPWLTTPQILSLRAEIDHGDSENDNESID